MKIESVSSKRNVYVERRSQKPFIFKTTYAVVATTAFRTRHDDENLVEFAKPVLLTNIILSIRVIINACY